MLHCHTQMPIDSTWYVLTLLAHSFSTSAGRSVLTPLLSARAFCSYSSVERQGASMIRISHVRALEGKDKGEGTRKALALQNSVCPCHPPTPFAPRAPSRPAPGSGTSYLTSPLIQTLLRLGVTRRAARCWPPWLHRPRPFCLHTFGLSRAQ